MAFLNEYACALDDKGRLAFPAKMREEMGEAFYITRWFENCLVVFPTGEWEKVLAAFEEKSLVSGRKARRFLFAGAEQLAPDKQGRVLVPPALRKHAGLEKDVVVAGAGRYVEIWDVEAWRQEMEDFDYEAAAEVMEGMGM